MRRPDEQREQEVLVVGALARRQGPRVVLDPVAEEADELLCPGRRLWLAATILANS